MTCFHPEVCVKQDNGYRCECSEGWVKGKGATLFNLKCRGKLKLLTSFQRCQVIEQNECFLSPIYDATRSDAI